MSQKITIEALRQMKRDGRKIAAVVVYDHQMAQIADRAGVDIVSAGDSVGVNAWGQQDETDVTLDQMLLTCTAVRRGVARAVVSCDVPYTALQHGPEAAVEAARTLVTGGGADIVKLEADADIVRAVVRAGIPVWAQFGVAPSVVRLKPDTTYDSRHFIAQATLLESAGAAMLDFRHSGPEAGAAVAKAVSIPVLGGLGGGPWLDGRVRALGNAVGNLATALDDGVERYANVARITLDAIAAYADDVRASRQVKGDPQGGPSRPART